VTMDACVPIYGFTGGIFVVRKRKVSKAIIKRKRVPKTKRTGAIGLL